MHNIFLSASIPSIDRNPEYYKSADFIAIREAVLAVATVVVPNYKLVWGGHPAITPLIRHVYQRYLEEKDKKLSDNNSFSDQLKDHVVLYQSEFFSRNFPKDNDCFEEVIVTPAKNTREDSLYRMREKMIKENDFLMAIFIGGMEGVEDEYKMFVDWHPDTLALPLSTTGAAAKSLSIAPCTQNNNDRNLLLLNDRVKYDRAYISLLLDSIEIAKKMKNIF